MGPLRTRFAGPVIDTGHNAPQMAHFYATLLGWRVAERGPKGWWAIIQSPHDPPLKIEFAGSPDYRPPVWPTSGNEQQMMMHLDIEVNDIEAAVAVVINLGGSEAQWQPPNRDPSRLRVMVDPAGHPFCLFLHA